MELGPFVVPVALFAMIAYIVKLISDNRLRRRVLDSSASEEMAEALLKREWSEPRTRSALKWGLISVSLGAGVLVVDVLAIGFESPLAYAVLLLAAGAALLGYYLIEHDTEPAARMEADPTTPPTDRGAEGHAKDPTEAMADSIEDPER
jgi:hypothetical protein